MPKNKLFDDEEPEEDSTSFKTENDYAKRYDRWREKEELYKLEQKYGDKSLASDASVSSDSEDESDEPVEVTPEMEKQFLKTLSLLKTKDPRIYDPQFKFFDDETAKKQEEEKIEEKESKPKKKVDSLAAAFADSDDEDDGEEIFTVEKKAEVPAAEEDKIKAFLTGQVEHVEEEVEQDLAPLKALWSDPQLNEGEAFLRDYILNKKYLEEGDLGEGEEKLLDDEGLEQDEKTVEEQGNFERAYNFRFEEPDEQYLKRYPRTMNYIRPKDDKRSKKRQETRTRKEEEKKRKMDEIARLKALKLKEIQEKISKIKEVTGNQELAFKETDIEGDFDPEEHDRRMKAIFDEQYYVDVDQEKPVFPDLDDELEIENWDKFEKGDGEEQNEDAPHCEDEDFNMDADYDPVKSRQVLLEQISATLDNRRRRRKKRSKLAEILAEDKPIYLPGGDKTYEQFMSEYYAMECEDVIAGEIPTRFKYRETVANTFGLTVEEILLADDKELNKWASLKKTVKYRPDHIEKGEVKTYEQKAQDIQLKRKILPSLFKDLPEEPELIIPPGRKTKKKKNKNKKKNDKNQTTNEDQPEKAEEIVEKKELENSLQINGSEDENKITVDTEKEEDLETKKIITENVNVKKKNKKKKRNNSGTFIVEDINSEVSTSLGEVNGNDKSSDKKKKTENITTANESLVTSTIEEVNFSSTTSKKKKKSKNKNANLNTENQREKSNLKRKLDDKEGNPSPAKKKKKNNNKNKQKFNNKKINHNDKNTSNDPLSKLSDGRLKAYGLNPKKYRSFLKYKKF